MKITLKNVFNKCLSLAIDWNPVNLTLLLKSQSLLQKWKFEKSGNIINQNHCLEAFLDSEADGNKIG